MVAIPLSSLHNAYERHLSAVVDAHAITAMCSLDLIACQSSTQITTAAIYWQTLCGNRLGVPCDIQPPGCKKSHYVGSAFSLLAMRLSHLFFAAYPTPQLCRWRT